MILLSVGIVCAGFLAFANSFKGAFVFDDHGHIVSSENIRELVPITTWLLGNPRPVVTFTLAVNYAIGKLDPFGYHVVNLAIHLLAALTLFGIVRRSLLRIADRRSRPGAAPAGEDSTARRFDVAASHAAAPWLAAVIALLWVVHPLQTQSVTYVIQRSESLMGLFYLLTLYCFIRAAAGDAPAGRAKILFAPSPNHRASAICWYAASVLCCALGMGSKVVMVTAPLVVLLYDRIFVTPSFLDLVRRRWPYYLGLLLTLSVIQAVGQFNSVLNPRPGFPVSAGFGMQDKTWWDYLRSQPEVILHYLRLCFWPHPLCLDYEWPVAQSGYYAKGSVILLLLAATAVLLWKTPAPGFAAAWFFIVLGPSSSFIPVKDLAMEHRMYLPLAGVITLAVLGGYRLLVALATPAGTAGNRPLRDRSRENLLSNSPLPPPLGILAAGLVVLAASSLGVATHDRNKAYYSSEAMWRSIVELRPTNARALFGLGAALIRAGKPDEAAAYLERAKALDPRNAPALLNLAQALAHQGKLDEAVAQYEQVLRIDPQFAAAYNNLGTTYLKKQEPASALAQFERAIQLEPNFVSAHVNKGRALVVSGRMEEAVSALAAAVQIAPDSPEARMELANLLVNLNRADEAVGHYREALRHKPDSFDAHLFLGNSLTALGRANEAIEPLRAAVRLDPSSAEARNSLGFALAASGRPAEAIREYDEALRLSSSHVHALLNRGNARRDLRQLDAAIADYQAALRLDSNDAIAHSLLGSVLLEAGRPNDALAELQEALRLNPNLLEAIYEFGLGLERTDRLQEAKSAYREVLRRSPDHDAAARRLHALLAAESGG